MNTEFTFKDATDGNFAVVVAKDLQAARDMLNKQTSLKFMLVGQKSSKTKIGIVWNDILSF